MSGVGGITESDVTLAEASGAAIIGFNVRAHKEAREAAERAGIEIRYYNIIYNLVDDVKAAMSGLLAPKLRETMLGNAQILEIFNVSKVGKVAGCRVTDGKVERGANVRLIRDNVVIHEGKLSTAQALQGRGARSAGRPGMRHGLRELPGHARRRRDRVLPRRDGAAVALSPSLRRALHHCPSCPRRRASSNSQRASMQGKTGCTAASRRRMTTSSKIAMPRHHHRDHASAGPSQRQLRVGELIRHALAEMLSRGEVHDPVIEGHMITVPEVRMTADLRLATIYVMPLGGRDAKPVIAALERNKKFLRGEIAHRINLKFAPDIRFRVRRTIRRSGTDREDFANTGGPARPRTEDDGDESMSDERIAGCADAEPLRAARRSRSSASARSATCTAGSCSTSRSA